MAEQKRKKAMIKLVDTAFVYAVLAMAGGVFYREFTKFNVFGGKTDLAFVHTHLFLLGMMFFLIAALFEYKAGVTKQKGFGLFYAVYNTGIAITVIMLVCRGIAQIVITDMAPGPDAAISGIAGLGHILTGAGMILYFVLLKRSIRNAEPQPAGEEGNPL